MLIEKHTFCSVRYFLCLCFLLCVATAVWGEIPTPTTQKAVSCYEDAAYWAALSTQAEKAIVEKKPVDAVRLIEQAIHDFRQWEKASKSKEGACHDHLSKVYWTLAHAKATAGKSQSEIAECFEQSLEKPIPTLVYEQAVAIEWLTRNTAPELRKAMSTFCKDKTASVAICMTVRLLATRTPANNFSKYKPLLDAIAEGADDPVSLFVNIDKSAYADVRGHLLIPEIAECLPEYCVGKEALYPYAAETLFARAKYDKALTMYRTLRKKATVSTQRCIFGQKSINCLKQLGHFTEAVEESDALLRECEKHEVPADILYRVLITKAECLALNGALEDAVQVLSGTIKTYPGGPGEPEAEYLLGYCQFLEQNRIMSPS